MMRVYQYLCKISGAIAIAIGVGLQVNGILGPRAAATLGIVLFFLAALSIRKIAAKHFSIAAIFTVLSLLFVLELTGVMILLKVYNEWYAYYWGVAVVFLLVAQRVDKLDHLGDNRE